jgi:uncharacterized protein
MLKVAFTVAIALACIFSSAFAQTKLPETRLKIGAHRYILERTVTPEQSEHGLMGRKFLPQDHGMLFSFDPASDKIRFWMKNTLIPLDMVFVNQGKVVYVKRNALPCPESESARNACPVYGPDEVVDQVIELPAGTAERDAIMPGLRVTK